METTLAEQADLAKRILAYASNYSKTPDERRTIEYIEPRLKDCIKLWQQFETNNTAIEADEDVTDDQPYFAENTYEKTKKKYLEFMAAAQLKLFDLRPKSSEPPETEEQKQRIQTVSTLKTHLTDLIEISKLGAADASLGFIEMQLETLKEQWSDYKTAYFAAVANASQASQRELKKSYERIYKSFIEAAGLLQDARAKQKTDDSPPATKRGIELPKLKIPEFDGKISAWNSFYELFNEIIHKNKSIDNATKMHYLKSVVKGEAARLIAHLHSTAENYGSAFDILIKRYENTRILLGKLLDSIFNLPQLNNETCHGLKNMHDTLFECLKGIENLNVPTDNWDPILTHLLTKKLDKDTRKHYECQLDDPRAPQKIGDFLTYIESRFMALEAYEPKTDDSAKREFKKNETYKKTCTYCDASHSIFDCETFKNLGEQERIDKAKEKKLCMKCLRSNHKTSACKSTTNCKLCEKQHNTLLHLKEFVPKKWPNKNEKNNNNNENRNVASMVTVNSTNVLLATALVNVQTVNMNDIILKAVIDQGSQSSFVTEYAAQLIGFPRTKITATISGIGASEKQSKYSMKLTVKPRLPIHPSTYELRTEAIIMPRIMKYTPLKNNNKWEYIDQLNLADPNYDDESDIDLLLGAADYAQIIKRGLIKGEIGEPIAQNTELGWIVTGQMDGRNDNKIKIVSLITTAEVDGKLKRFWELNEMPEEHTFTEEENKCELHYGKTHRRLSNGRYMVNIPFQNGDRPNIGDSKNMAIATFIQMEKRFAKDEQLRVGYKQFIDEYIQMGHMVPVNNHDGDNLINYLPHHAIFKESTTTKLRVVFDASRKTTNKKSLNDCMLIGPQIQDDMVSLIMRWRKYAVAFTADIEKMYRQILIDEKQTDLQRIIWRDSPNEPFREYKLVTVTYGTSSAPFLAIRTLHQLAKDEAENYPNAAKLLLNNFYVDDTMAGADTVAEAIAMQKELKQALKTGGFNLRKWTSNDETFIQSIPIEDREFDVSRDIHVNETIKTLGIHWNPIEDVFQMKISKKLSLGTVKTKRMLLSEIASLYDPLGWIAPVIIKAKILIQELWTMGLTWDEQLPEHIKQKWQKIKDDLPKLEEIKIPRWLKTRENCYMELHGFSDASEVAYAAAIYLKTIENGTPNVSLLLAKTRVAPLKKLTIPRLELCGALLLSELVEHVKNTMHIKYENIYLWCDSKVVLGWIKGSKKRWMTFVANKTMKIHTLTDKKTWNHVTTEQNPADHASRGILPRDMQHLRSWWSGPDWLQLDKQYYPKDTEDMDTSLEVKACNTTVEIHTSILPHNPAFNMFKLQKTMAYCLRFIANCKRPQVRSEGHITTAEFNRATDAIIRIIQAEEFADDIHALTNGQMLSKRSEIKKLRPFIDDKKILRVGGRLQQSQLTYDAKHQILLPNKHWVTGLIIKHAHGNTLHGGPRLTETAVRQKYWIPNGYRMIKKVIFDCFTCRRYGAKSLNQIMGNLPAARVTVARAFSNVGVDYAGPILVRMSKGRGSKTNKGYICVFICLATKAMHLELVSDLTAIAFLAAYRRFTARRGNVANIYSDNGTNFVKANKLLQINSQNEADAYNQTIYDALNEDGTHWHFIPPGTPHFGGLWEAGVKSVKTHLKKTVGDSTLTFEELSTLLYQIEACLNSRPLCEASIDPADANILTPGHFLIGASLKAPPDENVLDTKTSHLNRWQAVQKMYQQFWRHWSGEYLNRLQTRPKWLQEKDEPQLNELIIIKDETAPPTKWATGRIVRKHEGGDGKTRVVSVEINKKIKQYALHKICRLPMREDTEIKEDDVNNAIEKSQHSHNRMATTIVALLLTTIITGVHGTPSDKMKIRPFEHPPGVYFEDHGRVHLTNTNWNIIAYYDLDGYWQELQWIKDSIRIFNCACNGTNIKKFTCNEMSKRLATHAQEIEERNLIIRPNHERKRRATLDIVGNIAGDLFGIMDSRFAKEYANDIGKIQKNEDHLLALMRNHTSIEETTMNILRNDETAIKNNYAHIQETITGIQMITSLEEANTRLLASSINILNTMMQYEAMQGAILDIMLEAHKGIVNPRIITPTQIRAQIKIIRANVDRTLVVPGEYMHESLRSLYRIMNVHAVTMNNQLIFKVELPLLFSEHFQAYKLIPVPTVRDTSYTWIVPTTEYLLTTVNRNYFFPLTNNEFLHCTQYAKNEKICQRREALITATYTKYACEIELLTHKGKLNEGCQIKFTEISDVWLQLHQYNTWIYVIHRNHAMDVICGDTTEHIELQGEGIMHLQQGCTIRHNGLEIAARHDYESSISKSILPRLSITDNVIAKQWQKELAIIPFLNGSHINELQRLINTQRENEAMDLDALDDHHIHHYTLEYITVIIVIILIILIMYLYRKFRSIQAAQHPRRRPIRAISMPNLGGEDVL